MKPDVKTISEIRARVEEFAHLLLQSTLQEPERKASHQVIPPTEANASIPSKELEYQPQGEAKEPENLISDASFSSISSILNSNYKNHIYEIEIPEEQIEVFENLESITQPRAASDLTLNSSAHAPIFDQSTVDLELGYRSDDELKAEPEHLPLPNLPIALRRSSTSSSENLSSPSYVSGRRIVTTISSVTGLALAIFFTGGTAILPATAIVAASSVVGYNASALIPNLTRSLGHRFGHLLGYSIINPQEDNPIESENTTKYHAETGSRAAGTIAGLSVFATALATGAMPLVPATLVAAGTIKAGEVLARRGHLGEQTMIRLGRFIRERRENYAIYNSGRVRQSEYPRPTNMAESLQTRILQDEGQRIIARSVAAGVGILTFFSGGGALFAPQAAAATYVVTAAALNAFMNSTTLSENTHSHTQIGDRLAQVGKLGQEMKGAGWSIPPLILSKFTNDTIIKGALAGIGAVNFAAALADTATAAKLMKHTSPAKIEVLMKYNRVRYKLYRALAWGIIFDAGASLLINCLIPPFGLAQLKMSPYFFTLLTVGGLACTTAISYCSLKYLDIVTLFCCTKFSLLCRKKNIKNPDILIDQGDLLVVNASLVKGLGHYKTRQRVKEAEFTRPQNESAIFVRQDFNDQAAVDDFNKTVAKNAEKLYGNNSNKKIISLELKENNSLAVKHVNIFTNRGNKVIRIAPDGSEATLHIPQIENNLGSSGEEKEPQPAQALTLPPISSVHGYWKSKVRPPENPIFRTPDKPSGRALHTSTGNL